MTPGIPSSAVPAAAPTARDELLASVGLLCAVVLFALAGLGSDGNWPKVLRVGAAAAAYLTVLLSLALRRDAGRPLPWWTFAAAGAAAGGASAAVRALMGPAPAGNAAAGAVVAAAGAALLLGTVHWAALRHWHTRRG
jgi:hypothetical protein